MHNGLGPAGAPPILNPNNLTIRQFLGDPSTNQTDKAVLALTLNYNRTNLYPGWIW